MKGVNLSNAAAIALLHSLKVILLVRINEYSLRDFVVRRKVLTGAPTRIDAEDLQIVWFLYCKLSFNNQKRSSGAEAHTPQTLMGVRAIKICLAGRIND